MVAAGHSETVKAAAYALRAGGNAVDATLAGVFASFIAEPTLTGLFGGGIMIVSEPSGAEHLLDCFARVPGLGGPGPGDGLDFQTVDVNFGPTIQQFHVGRGSAAIPGTMSGLWEAHQRWGRLPMEALVEPACALATEGVPLTPQMAYISAILGPILEYTPEVAALFAPDGGPHVTGDLFRNPDLRDLLHRLAREGMDGPTRRALDGAMLDAFSAPNGLFTADDLAQAAPIRRTPRRVRFAAGTVSLAPPPMLGGSVLAVGLEVLDALGAEPPASVAAERKLAEALAAMSHARREDPADLLSQGRVSHFVEAARAHLGGGTPTGSTTHISVIDREGWAVGMTHSNGEGSGVAVPGSGVMMNNFLGEEDINPLGFHQQPAGEPMMTMMSPVMLTLPEAGFVLGSGGSNRIRSALTLVIRALAADGMGPEPALHLPRMHVEGDTISLETGLRGDDIVSVLDSTRPRSVHFDEPNMFFGGVHIAGLRAGGFCGAGDPRRGGDCHVVITS